MRRIKRLIQYLIGFVFITSAILKLLSIDQFEVYIFSLNIFSFDLSSVFARLIITSELFIGICLITHIYIKQIWYFTLSVLIVFTLFITYLVLTGETENCHCFGNTIQLSPLASLLKNIVLVGLMIFIKPTKSSNFKYQKILLPFILAVAILVPFIISPPDGFLSSDISTEDVDMELLNKIRNENHIPDTIKIIGFLGPGCKYCKLTAQKINTLKQDSQLDNENIYYVFWGQDEKVQSFLEKTRSQQIPYSIIDTDEFLTFTKGKMPVILLMDKDTVLAKLKYRSLNEKTLSIAFPLKKEK